MGVIFATRSIRNIMEATLAFGAQAPFIEAVNFAFRDMCTAADQEVFDGICQRVLAVDLINDLTTTKKLNDSLQ
ncbi:hypothetical protein D3C72_2321550 [compost metagenome]